MKLHSVYLRDDCILPDSFNPPRQAVAEHWMRIDGIASHEFDVLIQHACWHYIWLRGSCSRRGCARTEEAAIDRGLTRALKAISGPPNAAELDSIQITSYPWFHVANVTVQYRRIQESSLLEAEFERSSGQYAGPQ